MNKRHIALVFMLGPIWFILEDPLTRVTGFSFEKANVVIAEGCNLPLDFTGSQFQECMYPVLRASEFSVGPDFGLQNTDPTILPNKCSVVPEPGPHWGLRVTGVSTALSPAWLALYRPNGQVKLYGDGTVIADALDGELTNTQRLGVTLGVGNGLGWVVWSEESKGTDLLKACILDTVTGLCKTGAGYPNIFVNLNNGLPTYGGSNPAGACRKFSDGSCHMNCLWFGTAATLVANPGGTVTLTARTYKRGSGAVNDPSRNDPNSPNIEYLPEVLTWTGARPPGMAIEGEIGIAASSFGNQTGTFTNFRFSPFLSTPSAPTNTLSANPTSIQPGSSSTLSWSSTGATSCEASDGWSGPRPTSSIGELTDSLNADTVFTLICTGPGGLASQSITVVVSDILPPGTFVDGFERTPSDSLGNEWSEVTGNFTIENNELRSQVAAGNNLAVVNGFTEQAVFAQAVFASINNNASPQFCVVVRYVDALNYYKGCRLVGGTSVLRITRMLNGVERVLTSVGFPNPATNVFFTIELRAQNSSLALLLNGIQKVTAVDTSFTSGGLGIFVSSKGQIQVQQRIDNFVASVHQ